MTSTPLIVHSPAKLNLGLDVLGRREDGYHELLTVLQAVDLADEIEYRPAPDSFAYLGDPGIDPTADIVRPILERRAVELGWKGRLALRKRIPVAAGLGGGSSDAALALKIAFHGETADELERRAASIGSDVPFFIRGGASLASGVGTQLHPLPACEMWFVIVVPDIELSDKTGSMYAGLEEADYSSGASVRRIAAAIERGGPLPDDLPNPFLRQMLSRQPVARAWQTLRAAAGRVALSGTGPSVFSWFQERDRADEVAQHLRGHAGWRLFVARGIGPDRSAETISRIAQALRGGA